MPEVSLAEWNAFVSTHHEAHLLQAGAWGELKSAFGWQTRRLINGDAGAQVLFRRLAPGMRLAYLARGPVGTLSPGLREEISAVCQIEGVFALKVEPDLWEDQEGQGGAVVYPPGFEGFAPSSQVIQPPRTITISLAGSEDDILMRMKQKTRYNVRLAEKKGVCVRESLEVEAFHRLALETGKRDGFAVHSLDYYRQAFDLFRPGGQCVLLMAELGGELVSGLMAFRTPNRAWYLYGASSDKGRESMSTYLLQWQAMRWAKSAGCHEYDLWGIPDFPESELEAGFASRTGGLWGVYRFKRGFGGKVRRSVGAYDRVYKPAIYWLYQLAVRVKRERG